MLRTTTDWAKVIAALAVVGIHSTSSAETNFALQHNYASLDFLGVLVNQWARFSVPLFIYLSAYGLSRSTKIGESGFGGNYAAFVKKRLPTILVPYFFFSGIAIAMEFHSWMSATGQSSFSPQLWKNIASQILTGTADYHLYFLVILAQCYLLFPFLLKFRHSYGKTYLWSTWTIFAAIVFLLYKGTSEWVLPRLGLTHPAWHASFVVYWLPYFMLGILHGTMPMEAKPYRRSLFVLAFLLCAAALALVFVEYDSYSRLGTPVDYYNHFSRPTVVLYTLAIIGLLFALPRSVETKGGHGERLAALTFAVYLIHPQVLRIVTPSMLFLPSIVRWLLVAIATFVLVYIFTALIKKASNANNPALLRKTAGLLQRCLGLR